MAVTARLAVKRWGKSLGVRLSAAIAREAHLLLDQEVELSVVDEGVLIRSARPRLSLVERLAECQPIAAGAAEAMAWDPIGSEVVE